MLASDWKNRKKSYDFVIIGSGYGGAITAARIAAAGLNKSVCILERGREWPVGTFPDTLGDFVKNIRDGGTNPLGLYEFLNYRDITVLKGSGLGGTSLINANVAIVPDREVFERANWPKSLNHDSLLPYYARARKVLAARPHPRAMDLGKVKALQVRASKIGKQVEALNIAVNFDINGQNPHGVEQKPCIDCGDCFTGCNVGSKNTLYMNYLPMARNAGAEIFTQVKVRYIKKRDDGSWRVHGTRYETKRSGKDFEIDAGNVILCAGSINSTEILMRSEMKGLPVSPALGTGFSGNGDFFGIAYNSDHVTDTLGYGGLLFKNGQSVQPKPGDSLPPGPLIVGAIRYDGSATLDKRFIVEDLSFPKTFVEAAQGAFAAARGEDTDTGDEQAERERIKRDLTLGDTYNRDGALNHTMFYLIAAHDDARGQMTFEKDLLNPEGRLRIEWDDAGRQIIFTRVNEELRRHARALGASFISNPTWSFLDIRRLITVHPLGGCPIGEDYIRGAVDEYGRVFSGDGTVHKGLFVADGALVPSALGVNPFLTISALAERIAERKIQEMQGNPYPEPNKAVAISKLDPIEASTYSEGRLERLFKRSETKSIELMLNEETAPEIDRTKRTIRNKRYWKGFFPKGHILNQMSAAIFTGFKKKFSKKGSRYTGVTSDTDGRINARNSLEEIKLDKKKGTLEPGNYVLLRYLDLPWTGFYDIFKVINEDLLIGRVYLGRYPDGIRLFTFPMTRTYGFHQMTVDDHRQLYAGATVPTKQELNGVWRMDVISNANHAGGAAYLKFDLQPDGRLESRYQLMGLIEGLVVPNFVQDHFRLTDFTPFHDEIRKLDGDLFIGKYVADVPPGLEGFVGTTSLGIFHVETDPDGRRRFGFYYLLSKVEGKEFPTNTLLRPFLDVQLPDGIGMTFDEEMVGWYCEGEKTPAEWRAGDRTKRTGTPAGATECKFTARMTINDVNEFIDGVEHEAKMKGTVSFGSFDGGGPVTYQMDERESRFNYLRVNEQTGEAEMRYHIEFRTDDGRRFTLEGRKYMQRDETQGPRRRSEVLDDYTTLYCHVYKGAGDQAKKERGIGYLKFRTFEDIAAAGSFIEFLRSFKVTGTPDPILQFQAQMRFLAFTAQFVQLEYDPLSPDIN